MGRICTDWGLARGVAPLPMSVEGSTAISMDTGKQASQVEVSMGHITQFCSQELKSDRGHRRR